MSLWTAPGALITFIYLTTPFIVAFLLVVFLSLRRGRREARGPAGGMWLWELAWVLLVAAVWTVINLSSIGSVPEGLGGVVETGDRFQTLTVEAFMWGYRISPKQLAADVPVKLVASSIDTIHSVAVYSSDNRLLATVMLMPGMKEELVLRLPAGKYLIRCLEYCGDGHPFMLGEFSVGW
ncbi:MAG: hypothetical protein QXR26_08060 [Candidatus Caldarchaeum sp.]